MRKHDAHMTGLWVAQCARNGPWQTAGNLSFADVPVRQPAERTGIEKMVYDDVSAQLGADVDRHFVNGPDQRSTSGVASTRDSLTAVRSGQPGPLTLILPFPPTVNHSSMPNANGGRYLTEDHKSFRSAVAWIVKQRRLVRMTGRLRMLIELYPANNRRWDIDNRCKAVLDALQHAGLFADDECIDDLRITRQIAGNEAWCRVTVELLALPPRAA